MHRPLGVALATLLAGCHHPRAADVPDGFVCSNTWTFWMPQTVRTQLDVLFVIEDSSAMEAMQPALQARMAHILQPIFDVASTGVRLDLHIGVITTDLGAGRGGAPGCAPAPGRGGRLQAPGAAAPPGCRPPVGAPYIRYSFDPYLGDSHNLPDGQDLANTLACMVAVGANGCEYPQPLEAARAALYDPPPENAGFLREEALLGVVFVVASDDCSAPADSDFFDPARSDAYGPPGRFRCARFGLVCGDPAAPPPDGDSHGALPSCRPAPNPAGAGPGRLYDVERYIELFNNPAAAGGAKVSPLDVELAVISGPAAPVEVVVADPATPPDRPYECPRADAGNAACTPLLQRSCVAPAGLAGEPALRLQAVLDAVRRRLSVSFCADDYRQAVDWLWPEIVFSLGGGCLPFTLADPEHPDCSVEDVTENSDGTMTSTPIPRCDGTTIPCWRIELVDVCGGLSPAGQGLVIDRAHHLAPPHTTALVSCAAKC